MPQNVKIMVLFTIVYTFTFINNGLIHALSMGFRFKTCHKP